MRPMAAAAAAEEQDAMASAMEEMEALLGYEFRDPSLLAEALTHSSDTDHVSYQRLEFVGDAALCLAFTNYFYLTNPDLGPGPLSVLRAANISTEKLARVAVRHHLYRLLRRNSPKLDDMVEEFTLAVEREIEEEMYGQPSGGNTMKAPKVLADIVESIAAAVYVDCNFNLERLWTVFRGLLEPIITMENLDEQPVTTLYKYCQKKGKSVDFKNWRKGNLNMMNVFVDGELLGIGESEHQIIAKLNAARDALQKLGGLGEGDVEIVSVPNGGEDSNSSKHRLHELCTKKRWPKSAYSSVPPDTMMQGKSSLNADAAPYVPISKKSCDGENKAAKGKLGFCEKSEDVSVAAGYHFLDNVSLEQSLENPHVSHNSSPDMVHSYYSNRNTIHDETSAAEKQGMMGDSNKVEFLMWRFRGYCPESLAKFLKFNNGDLYDTIDFLEEFERNGVSI